MLANVLIQFGNLVCGNAQVLLCPMVIIIHIGSNGTKPIMATAKL